MLNMRVFGKKLAAFTLASLFLGTTIVAATEQTTTITGHVNWAYLSGYDPCIAAVAGLASSRVLWFDDSVLVDNYAFNDAFIYATEAGAPDPRGKTLARMRNFVFDDPNGVLWNVTEYQYYGDAAAGEQPVMADSGDTKSPTPYTGPDGAGVHAREDVRVAPYYTWTVALLDEPKNDAKAGINGDEPHDLYNFVLLVDTCKFFGKGKDVEHIGGHAGDPLHECSDQFCRHHHDAFLADLRIGGAPDERGIPVGETRVDYEQRGAGSNSGSHSTPFTP